MLTRDLQLDWGQVPDPSSGRIPAGVIQFVIRDYEEKMTSAEGLNKKGEPKVAKYMIQAHLEVVFPEEAAGMKRDEYFVLGSDADPMAQQASTFYARDNFGAAGLKGMLGAAQVPWSASLLATLNSSIGAMFLMQVKHRMEKARDGSLGEDGQVRQFVGVDTGRTYKLAEMVPRVIPCMLPACEDCKRYAELAGLGAPQTAQAPIAALRAAPPPPPIQAPSPLVQPGVVPPPVQPFVAPPVSAPPAVNPVQPVATAPPIATPAPPVQPVQPVAQPAPPMQQPIAVPQGAAVQPGGAVMCKICGRADIPVAELPQHLMQCATQAQGQAMAGFKQEA